jgi:thiamine transport system ATP-binding protein
MLTLSSLTYKWPGSKSQTVDLDAYSGQIVLISGPSGIGKTTLFDIISGFHQPKSGALIWNGENLLSKPPWTRPISTMFQADNFFPHLSVRDNIVLGLNNTSELKTKLYNRLEFLNVLSLLDRRPEQLSGGELQRVTLVRALMREKPMLLLDEPFSALDQDMIKKASQLISSYTEEVQSVTLIISHQNISSNLNASQLLELQ